MTNVSRVCPCITCPKDSLFFSWVVLLCSFALISGFLRVCSLSTCFPSFLACPNCFLRLSAVSPYSSMVLHFRIYFVRFSCISPNYALVCVRLFFLDCFLYSSEGPDSMVWGSTQVLGKALKDHTRTQSGTHSWLQFWPQSGSLNDPKTYLKNCIVRVHFWMALFEALELFG